MINEIVVFAAGWMLNWWALGILLFSGVLFERGEHRGMSVFIGIVSATVAFLMFHVPFLNTLIYTGIYLVIGVLWSFWRYKRYVDKRVAAVINMTSDSRVRKDCVNDIHPSKMIGTITSWIIIWPFSALENICGDIISFIETLVTTVFKSIYNKIYTSAISSLDIK